MRCSASRRAEVNVLEHFWKRVDSDPDGASLHTLAGGEWRALSWGEYGRRVSETAAAFRAQGLRPGDRVAIFSNGCAEWYIADFAALSARLVVTPLYPNLTAEQARYVIEHSESSV